MGTAEEGTLYPDPWSERSHRCQRRDPRHFLGAYIFQSHPNMLLAHYAGGTTDGTVVTNAARHTHTVTDDKPFRDRVPR